MQTEKRAPRILNRLPTLDDILEDLFPLIQRSLEAACGPREGCPHRLGEAMRYSLLGPGKRLRPALVLLGAEAAGGNIEDALPAAVAVEMVHAYSLIHDDLPAMDDDDLRRGRPTCHIAFDEATAILAGDALLARAFEVLAVELPAPVVADAVRILAAAAGPTALVGGQADDLSDHAAAEASSDTDAIATGGHASRVQQLESIHARKTGALFSASLTLGGVCVGAPAETQRLLQTYAQNFGLAFQIVDDLLDYLGSSELLGKRTGKDIALGKLTFPGVLGVEASRRRAEALTETASETAKLLGEAGERLSLLAQFVLQRSR
jgi:geranylgeranyl diphosphate synthase type II